MGCVKSVVGRGNADPLGMHSFNNIERDLAFVAVVESAAVEIQNDRAGVVYARSWGEVEIDLLSFMLAVANFYRDLRRVRISLRKSCQAEDNDGAEKDRRVILFYNGLHRVVD